MNVKLCLWCKNFYFSQEVADYSEWTPGESANIYCSKDIWHIDLAEDTTSTYRKKILSAQSCGQFELSAEINEEAKLL